MSSVSQAHGISNATRVSAADAEHVARVMSALGTPSRVRILARLREEACTVSELRLAVAMEQPAVSHQLRILKDLGLVVGIRQGRHVVYGLYDPHVATLLDEALRHIRHLRAEDPDLSPPVHPNQQRSTMTPDEHTHEDVHTHAHEHDGDEHAHPHTEHDHNHVEHPHEHEHDGETHAHAHVHQEGLEDEHAHPH